MLSQAPPVIHCSLVVSTCPPASGHLLTESTNEFAEFPGSNAPLVSEELRFSFGRISSSWNTGFSCYISLEGSPFEAVSTLLVLRKHLRYFRYQEGHTAVCQAPPVPYLCWKPLPGWRGQGSAALAWCQAPPVSGWCVSVCPLAPSAPCPRPMP